MSKLERNLLLRKYIRKQAGIFERAWRQVGRLGAARMPGPLLSLKATPPPDQTRPDQTGGAGGGADAVRSRSCGPFRRWCIAHTLTRTTERSLTYWVGRTGWAGRTLVRGDSDGQRPAGQGPHRFNTTTMESQPNPPTSLVYGIG